MITDRYLSRSRVVRSLMEGPLGEHIYLYIDQLQRQSYSLEVGHRLLSVVRDFGFWLASPAPTLPISMRHSSPSISPSDHDTARQTGQTSERSTD
jgi:hypothetical protein